jgi:hypothetical protein
MRAGRLPELTHSGHRPFDFAVLHSNSIRCDKLSSPQALGRHEAARVHQASRRRGGDVAACGTRAAAAEPVVGFLNVASPGALRQQIAAFREGLKESGYVEGQNVAVEYRWAEGQYERLPELAADLVRQQVSVIV